MVTLTPDFADFLPEWIAHQRWYTGKGSAASLRPLGRIRWEDPLGEVGIQTHLVVDDSGDEPVVYQIPLTYRAEPVDFMADGLVAQVEHSELGSRWIYDATYDPVFVQTLLQHVYDEQDVPSARAHRVIAGGTAPALASSKVLSGEQSNTSVIVTPQPGGYPVIVKIFRVLHPGENPDVTVQSAIARTGNRAVPGPIGYLEGRWADPSGADEVRGHLAFVQEFLPDTQDAWREALVAAQEGTDFTEQARTLGAATAGVHAALREAFDVQRADADARHEIVEQMRRRAETAVSTVPGLSDQQAAVAEILDRLESSEEPLDLQRIHGDYHLGQVLQAGDRGWVLLDFEGEPLRPLAERNRPDLAARDIAGMLRSFDYAAASAAKEGRGDRAEWARAAREAFLSGYAEEAGSTPSPTLLSALELDKALYEVVYEARNRPDWVDIPVGAVTRLVGEAGAVPTTTGASGPGMPLAAAGATVATVGAGAVSATQGGSSQGQSVATTEAADVTSSVDVASLGADLADAASTSPEDAGPTPDDFSIVPGDGLEDEDVQWTSLSGLDPAVHGPSTHDPEEGISNGRTWGGVADGTVLTDGRFAHLDPREEARSAAAVGAGLAQATVATAASAAAVGASAARAGRVSDDFTVSGSGREDAAAGASSTGASTADTGSTPAGGLPADSSIGGGTAYPRNAAEGGWDPALDEPVELWHPASGRASGGAVSASGEAPYAPVEAPAEMTLSPLPNRRSRRTIEEVEVATPTYPPASGSAGYRGDPQELRRRSWEEALSSPAILDAGGRRTRTTRLDITPAEPGTIASAGDGTYVLGVVDTEGRERLTTLENTVERSLPLDLDAATDLVWGTHRDPHSLLGAHQHDGQVTIRTLQPEAEQVSVVLAGGRRLGMVHETGGIWVAVVDQAEIPDYRLEVVEEGRSLIVDEAYRHGSALGATDLHLIGEGRHEELWKVLGSHVVTTHDSLGEVTGTRFAVWAPNARAVHVMGDFNGWDGTRHALRVHEDVGVWELFVPGIGAGTHYKYDITGPDGVRRAKADPMARATEVPPFNNSVVTVSSHLWNDHEWMERRAAGDIHHGPMSVYEVHLGSWRQGLNYEQLADELVAYVADMGFTHVELMPVMQHPYGPSWGYHVTGYYAADARFGHEDGLRYLIDRLHQAGVGVLLDWVPGHFATDPWALARFDGTPIYEHPDPRKGWHPEWGSYIFDYGRKEVRNFLVANATYWLEEFHADGLRVDGVASMLYLDYSRSEGQWIPNRYGGRENLEAVELLQETNATAYRRNPGVVMIAEESTSWPGVTAPTDEGGLGFGFKWNMGWMHDTLDYLERDPYTRSQRHHALTFSIVYAFSEKYTLPISHDEVVHGKGSLVRKMAGDSWQKLATTRAFLGYQWSHPGKQLLFMGSEFAQTKEWADSGTLSWELLEQPAHAGVQSLVRDLNRLYVEHPALWQIDHHKDGFAWLDADDTDRNLYSYLRWGNEGPDGLRPVVAVLVNFSGIPQHGVHTGLPYGGRWREVLNTDAETYGGSGQGNMGYVQAHEHPHQGQPFSALVTVPPLGAVWLVPDPEPEVTGEVEETETEFEAGIEADEQARAEAAELAAKVAATEAGRAAASDPLKGEEQLPGTEAKVSRDGGEPTTGATVPATGDEAETPEHHPRPAEAEDGTQDTDRPSEDRPTEGRADVTSFGLGDAPTRTTREES